MDGMRVRQAAELMAGFADRTGLNAGGKPERYLWTDAFAVCNWLGMGQGEPALRLVNQVHHTLGQYRGDDQRRGWLSGLDATGGEAHPTRGGLRIGKKLAERRAEEPLDETLEWDRDGQYFHYLTKWMHALDQAARVSKQPLFNRCARELAAVAHAAFTYTTAGHGRRMYWKMSIDLSRPLVASMGHHDPLDGYVTCVELEATASQLPDAGGEHLAAQTADFESMISSDLATVDPLGLGGLLADAYRVHQLSQRGASLQGRLRERLLGAALIGLEQYARGDDLRQAAGHRLAFRELGLAIGLAVVETLREQAHSPALDGLARFLPLRDEIESFWLHPPHRQTGTWFEHQNINDVMLATCLAPLGYLELS